MATSQENGGGYPLAIFGNVTADEKFVCKFCDLVLRDPMQSFCGHRFCKSCVEAHISGGTQLQCKRCEQEGVEDDFSLVTRDQMYPDNAVKREMSKLHVYCVNSGCDWNGIFKQYEEHCSACPYQTIPCTDCNELVTMGMMEEHKKQQCPQRVIICKHCKDSIRARENEEHLKVCPKKQIKCEACRKQLLREQMQHHTENECQSIPCPAECGLILKSKYLDHLNSNIPLHMNWTIQNMGSMQNQVGQIQVNTSTSINEVGARIQGHIQEIDNRMDAIRRQLIGVINHGLPLRQNIDLKIRQAVELHQTPVSDRLPALEMKMGGYECIRSAHIRDFNKIIERKLKFEELRRQTKETVEQNRHKLRTLERTIALKDIAIAKLELRVQSLESASYDGTFIWKVTEFSKKQQDAINGRNFSIYSPFFYTSRQGFKMCARLYPNGNGIGEGSHLSLFFVVMRDQYDALQNWPFKQLVSFCLVNQNGGEHVLDSFRPDPTSSSFRRPTSDMNIASGCPLFIRLESLTNPSNNFMKDDTLFIKVTVDTNELP